MLKKLLLFTLILNIQMIFSQNVKIKDGIVYLDGSEILKHEKISFTDHSFFNQKEEEIIFYKEVDDLYFIINFINENIKVESTKMEYIYKSLILNSEKNMTNLLKWLIKEKVIDNNGNLDISKIEIFYKKHNENVSENYIEKK